MDMYGRSYRFGLGTELTSAVKYLLIANIAAFVCQILFERMGFPFTMWFALNPHLVINELHIWQLFSYMFLHGGVWHLFFNMLMLWIFGSELERSWGSKEFFIYYVVCGVGAGLLQMFFQDSQVVGASGAVLGLLMAFGMLFPDRVITFLFMLILPIQIKAKYLVMIIVGMSVLGGLIGGDGVAHFAHLGGMLVGFLYLKVDWPWKASGHGVKSQFGDDYTPQSAGIFSKLTKLYQQRSESKRNMEVIRHRQHDMHLREKVDVILDKINEVGYDNLTEEEKQDLKRASQMLGKEQMRSQNYGPN